MKKQWSRIMALLLVIMLSVGLLPDAVNAQTQEGAKTEAVQEAESSQNLDQPQSSGTITYINPLYADVIDESDLKKPEGGIKDSSPYASNYYTTISDAANVVREEMKERKETIEVHYQTTDGNRSTLMEDIFEAALIHTGAPDEGDYLMWQWGGWEGSYNWSINGNTYNYTFSYTITYYTTAQQEAQVDSKIPQVLAGLNLDGKTSYQKVKTIYDYICDNVVYDYANLNNENYKLQYTAYAALFNKTAVCQGYSVLFYRMVLEEGIDARVITGDGGGPHAWNIVRLGSQYYNLDSTWDAGQDTYSYFLTCNANFDGHTRDDEYNTASFNATYPMSAVDYDPASEPVLINVNQCNISLDTTDFVYDGNEKKPKVTVKYGNAILTENTDYKVGYSDNINAGTAKVSIEGMGDYAGVVTKEFTIKKAEQILNVSVEKNSIKVGETLAITTGGTEKGSLTYSSDQTAVAIVSTEGIITGIGEGSAIITVTAAGDNNYNLRTEKISITVEKMEETTEPTTEAPTDPTTEAPTEPTTEAPPTEPTTQAPAAEPTTQAPSVQPTQPAVQTPVVENPQPTTVKKLKNKRGKKVVVTWEAKPGVSGYLIQCAVNKKFTKKVKEYTADTADMTSGTIPKLKKYTYYYVRIKTYKENSDATYYSDWSNVKKVLVYR